MQGDLVTRNNTIVVKVGTNDVRQIPLAIAALNTSNTLNIAILINNDDRVLTKISYPPEYD